MDVAQLIVAVVGVIVTAGAGYLSYKVLILRPKPPADTAPPPPPARISVAIVTMGTQVLMVRRNFNAESLTWHFPAGQMNPGESAEHRAAREVQKETAVECRPEGVISERTHPQTGAHCTYVRCSYVRGDAHNADPQENAEVAWIEATEVRRKVTTDLDGAVQRFLDTLLTQSA